MKKRLLSFLLVLCMVLFAGCSNYTKKSSGKPVIYTSFFPVHDLVKMIAGDTVEVRTFMPVDKEPHLWEPSAKDMKKLADADLLVVNGANMEHWVDKVHENLPNLDILKLSDSVELITYKGAAARGDFQYMARLDLTKGKRKIDFGHTHEDIMRVAFFKDNGEDKKELVKKAKEIMNQKGEIVHQKNTFDVEEGKVYGLEMGHESGEIFYNIKDDGKWIFVSDRISEDLLPYYLQDTNGKLLQDEGKLKPVMEGSSSGFDKITYDPHSWLSVVNAKKYLNSIQDKLIQKYPDNKKIYHKNKLKYVDKLTDIDAEYKEKFSKLDNKSFLVTHYAYAYIARDFGLTQYPLEGLTSMESPSLKTIKKAVDFAKTKKITTVFYEYGKPPKEAKTLSEELGGDIKPLASMEFVTKEQQDNNQGYIELIEMNLKNLYESMKKAGV
ncbi:MAG: zinc ABC transporter substrate-binding protein [Finegoldia magna]|nr:zinc ABC transporter substrate-binding protein [Finegoldia magna]